MNDTGVKSYWIEPPADGNALPRFYVEYKDGVISHCWLDLSQPLPFRADSREALMTYMENKMEEAISSCHLYAEKYRKEQAQKPKGKVERVN
jgi:hypothetical protein